MSDSGKQRHIAQNFGPFYFFKWGGVVLALITVISTLFYWGLGRYYGRADWTLMNCLFMVIITLTTIGYGDWLELKSLYAAEVYTMLLAMLGIAVPAFVISNLTALIVNGLFSEQLRRRRMDKLIASLKDHVIVCGLGTTGAHCLAELVWTGRKVVAIDRDVEKLRHLTDELGEFPYVVGSAESDEVLRHAGIERASGLIACLTEDKDNVFVTLTARSLNRHLRIISKVIDELSRRKMIIAGANNIVNTTSVGGLRLVSELVRPNVVTFLDNMVRDKNTACRFEELEIQPGSKVVGKTLAQANLRSTGRALVIAAKKPGEKTFIYNPMGDLLLEPGLLLVLLASRDELTELSGLFRSQG